MLKADIVFLLDVDNTLLDNDRFTADLGLRLERDFGLTERDRYWQLFGELRKECGQADYLATLQAFRSGLDGHANLLRMSEFLLEYPFAARLYPATLKVLAHLKSLALTVVLSDGDIVFQPRKIQRSGVWDAVEGRVLIYLHKDLMLNQMQQRYPATRYVMVDDKANLLAAMKLVLGTRLTTVFVRQGHYALAQESAAVTPQPDRIIEHIGELLNYQLADF